MKKRFTLHLGISLLVLFSMVALPALVHAQEGEVEAKGDPVAVTEGHVEAVNNGDAAGAGEAMAEDAVVTVPQATSATEGEGEAEGEADPAAPAQYTGSAEYQAWLDAQAKANAQTTLGECVVEGDVVTCGASYTSDALAAKGVDFVEGELAVTVVEGQIQSYALTPSPESVAKLGALASAPGEGEVEPEPKAQATDPVTVTEGHVEAVNNGDTAAAEEAMAEDAVVTVPQATTGTGGEADADAEAEPEAQAQYTGSAEYQAWLDAQAAANAQTTLGECSVEGERVTCAASYTSEALKAKGVDFLEGMLAVTVVGGVIQSYAFTPSPESVVKLGAASSAPEAVPVTGGTTSPEVMPATGGGPTQGITYIMGVLAVLGLLLAGAVSAFAAQRTD